VLGLVQKRVKIEFEDGTGGKYTLAVEGKVSREKVLKIIDMMELMDGKTEIRGPEIDGSTSFGKVMNIIDDAYAGREFSTADITRHYEEIHGEPIILSTVSTYLSRLTERGILKRQKFGNSWVYRKVYLQGGQLPVR